MSWKHILTAALISVAAVAVANRISAKLMGITPAPKA
jgi:hypothetical protein